MGLTLVTAPVGEPISLLEAKAHCRVDNADEDGLLLALIAASRQHVEAFTHRALMTQTWDYKVDAFPYDACFELPLAPVSAISSIAYLDAAGTLQTWSSSNYLTDLPVGNYASRPRITPAYGISYPSTYGVMNAVRVRFVAGYGAAAAVPASIKAAMKILIGHWYMTREPVNIGNIVTPIPFSVESLLWPFKAF